MTQVLGGYGLTLPPPVALYPANITNTPPTFASNNLTLAPGQAIPIPAGFWLITLDAYSLFQWADPVTTTWKGLTGPTSGAPFMVRSDGVNFRIANLNGTPVSATVTAAGTGYPSPGTTVTASGTGGSQWVAVIGGVVNSTVSITAAGSGYGIPPLVFVPKPPSPGVECTMHSVISGGSVTSIIVDVAGAGYGTTAPAITILPDPYDPNFLAGLAITNATATCTVGGAGTVGAVLNLNPGASVTTAPTLTITGTGGSGATATATLQSSLTSISSPFIQPI
jgi:hypothetical protein